MPSRAGWWVSVCCEVAVRALKLQSPNRTPKRLTTELLYGSSQWLRFDVWIKIDFSEKSRLSDRETADAWAVDKFEREKLII